jgi:serine/threonine-protein kinase RsbW
MRLAIGGQPAGIAANLEVSFQPTAAAPAEAREALGAWLRQEPHDPAMREVALLLVSELVTNGLRHARTSADALLCLMASRRDTTVHVEVRDEGTDGRVAKAPSQRRDRSDGFGLELVEELSAAWGVERDADGTTVWLDLGP